MYLATTKSHANTKYSLNIRVMTQYELIKTNETVLKAMIRYKIGVLEVNNLMVYEEYRARKARKEKIGYIMCSLKEKYNISERSIYGIVKRMGKKIEI